jgi:hypothetical protein
VAFDYGLGLLLRGLGADLVAGLSAGGRGCPPPRPPSRRRSRTPTSPT